MRPRSHSARGTPRTQRAPRSPSTSSRSTSTSSPSRSLSPSSSRRRYMSTPSAHQIVHTSRGSTRRSSTTSTYRPRPRLHHPFIRMRARGGGVGGSQHVRNRDPPHVHVTIAPIAPTILKTTDSRYDGWAESFGDDGGSDDGLWGGKWGSVSDGEGWRERDKAQTRDGQTTPVELVYVPPPLVGRYCPGSDAEEEDFDPDAKEDQTEDDTPRPSSSVATLRIVADAPISESPEPAENDPSFFSTVTPPSPTVLVESLLQPLQERQAQKYSVAVFGNEVALRSPSDGQNLEDNLSRRPSSPEDRRFTLRSRSRTHSRSRTPSPAVSTPSSEIPPNAAAPAPAPRPVSRSSSVSPPDPRSSPSLLFPPVQRGRSASYQDLPIRGQRGRSSTRTPPSYSDRERQGESPIGSLSPDSSFVRVASIVGGVYAGGRTDKERQKERREEQCRERDGGRDRERGRDRTGKRSSQSLSPDVETGTSMKAGFSGDDHTSVPNGISSAPEVTYYVTGKVKSSSNGPAILRSSFLSGAAQATHPQEALPPLRIPSAKQDNGKTVMGRADEETQWTHPLTQPTPSNSPTITMKAALAGPATPMVDTTLHTLSQSQNASSSMKSYALRNSPASPHPHPSHTQSPSIARTPTTGGPVTSGVRSPMKGKSPLLVPPPPHPIEPSTSLSISPPGATHFLPVTSPQQPQGLASPTEKEPTIVDKAVGIMSTAGAFLGLWHP